MSQTLLVFNDIRAIGGRPISDLPLNETVRASDAFAALLRYGRDHGWLIAHVVRDRAVPCGPARGLEPLSSEPVFLLHARQTPDFERLKAAAACGVRVLILACFALNETALAILQAGLDLGLSVMLVAEGAGAIDARVGALMRAGVGVAEASNIIASEHSRVLWLADYLEGRGGHGDDNGI